MMRDLCAIMRIGQLLIGQSDNPQNEAAAKKLVYGLAAFLDPENMETAVRMSGFLDFNTSAAALTTLGDEELEWAKDLLYEVATTNVELNDTQRAIFDNLIDLYWQNQPADDDGRYDFEI